MIQLKMKCFMQKKNNGAFFNNHRIRVSKKNELNDCLFATGGKYKKRLDLTL